jgi:hypothetical protein
MHQPRDINKQCNVELAGLHRGITLAKDHGFSTLSVEGDSQLIIRGLQKILNGVKDDKVSHNWRLSHGLSKLGGMVTSLATIIPEQSKERKIRWSIAWPTLVSRCRSHIGFGDWGTHFQKGRRAGPHMLPHRPDHMEGRV